MDFDLPIETEESFEERIGKPNKFDAAMGRIVQSFSFLEDTLSNVISILLKFDGDLGNIITAELSFRNKVSLFSSLYKHFQDTYEPRNEEIDEHFQELRKALYKANELRNRIIHSRYILNQFRIKITSRGKKGLRKSIEKISPDYLLDISDYISEAAMALEEFPLHLGIADKINGNGKELVYYKDSKILYKFSFDVET